MDRTWEDVQTIRASYNRIFTAAIIASVAAPFVLILAGWKGIPVTLVWFVGVIVLWIMFSGKKKKYAEAYKEVVIRQAADGLFERYVYTPKAGYSREEIAQTGLMMMGNRFRSEDLVEGVYKGVDFRRADMYISNVQSTGKSSYEVIYLQGTWMSFEYNKEFTEDLQIVTRDFSYNDTKTGRLFVSKDERRHRLETESIEFNKAFQCYCEQDSEAFFILTPSLMKMLLLLKDELNHPFMVGFVNRKLHFVIDSRTDNMEPSMFGDSLQVEVEKNRKELKTICNIADSMALERKLFKA